ncbi:MAG: outer membrane beta-barrel protein [Bradymonadaceae bacterium]
MARRTPLALVLGAASLLLLSADTARAAEGDAATWVGAGLANAGAVTDQGPYLGLSAQTGIRFGLADFWNIQVGAEGAHHFPIDRRGTTLGTMQVADLFAGFRYNLDVFAYVPYVGASVVAFVQGPRSSADRPSRPGVAGKLEVGVDWRFTRHWSVGAKADLYVLGGSATAFPGYSTVSAVVSYHFHL